MILHCVFCHLRENADPAELDGVMKGLAALCGRLAGANGFEAGANRDFEAKSAPFSYGFVIGFDDPAALAVYADHPEHKALGARLCNLCVDGADGIRVYDLEV